MLLEKFQESTRLVRDAFYSAFGSPGLGVTWSVVTFLSGLLYLIYKERKRRDVETEREEVVAELEGSAE